MLAFEQVHLAKYKFCSSVMRQQRKYGKVMTISHFPIEQRTGSSRLFGGTKIQRSIVVIVVSTSSCMDILDL
jgi:hypothetical protein